MSREDKSDGDVCAQHLSHPLSCSDFTLKAALTRRDFTHFPPSLRQNPHKTGDLAAAPTAKTSYVLPPGVWYKMNVTP